MSCFNESSTNTQLKNEFDEMYNTYMNVKWSDNDIIEFSYVDVKYCIDMLKNDKAAGIDRITAEHVKYGSDL